MNPIRSRAEAGFTLIEVLAALSVFTITILGIIPLLVGAVKGAAVSRSYTVGKNLALEGMERARGLTYFVDYPTQKGYSNNVEPFRKVDILDLYFPNLTSSGYDSTSKTYTTTCSTSNSTNPACPRDLPAGFSLDYRARFVEPLKATVAGVEEETFQTVAPASGYRWNPPDPYTALDVAPSQILELTVTARWSYGGEARDFGTKALIGEREFGDVTVRAVAKVDHAIEVETGYTDTAGDKSELTVTGGIAESRVETKTASTADQTVRAGELELLTVPTDPTVSATDLGNSPVKGAETFLHAPPDNLNPAADSDARGDLVHPSLGAVAGIESTSTTNLKSSVSEELPTATGSFAYPAPATPTGAERLLWATGQLGPLNGVQLRLDGNQGLTSFRIRGGVTPTLNGGTSATTTPVGSGRKVETVASAAFGRLRLLPTSFIDSPVTDALGATVNEKAVILIDDFQASTTCRSTASTSGTAVATVQWSAKLRYWRDSNGLDGLSAGGYSSPIALSSTNTTDPLGGLGTADNPLVYDGLLPVDDVYLFEDPGSVPERRGYLRTWSSSYVSSGQTRSVDASGRVTQAAINGAIRIGTAPTDPGREDSGLSVDVGKLSCASEDQR
ncbi:MAG: type II secretion system protein [Actinobacteria bacterium]|nr:type II secretion system protein [Actinomycetota bacterium]